MDKVERVARVLCAADGIDSDEMGQTGSNPREFRASEPVISPRWLPYRDEARRFVAVFEAMRAAELEPLTEATTEGGPSISGS